MKTNRILLIIAIILFNVNASAQDAFEVKVSGNGEPLFLFPGFTCTAEVYEDIVDELSKFYEVHNFTFAGFGNVAPIDTPWLPKIKSSLEDYIDKNKFKNITVIGHSMGGTLGLWLASENSENYKKLIIVDALPAMGALMIPNYKSENMVYDNPFNDRMLQMEDSDFETMATQMATSMSLNENKHQQLKNWIIQADRKTYVYGYTDLLKLDLRENLENINIPVTILAATHPFGEETARNNYEDQYSKLKHYDLKFAEGSGHFIMFDKPEWFLNEVKNELSIK